MRQVTNIEGFGQLALIALGSNDHSRWGDQKETVQKGMDELAKLSQAAVIPSRFYSTPAYPAGSGPAFVNAVVAIHTNLSPDALLAALHNIEAAAGRSRTVRWGQRTLDLDLLAYGDQIRPDAQTHAVWRGLSVGAQQRDAPDELILPHPRLQERAFVLVPLADVAADWQHPILGTTVSQMLAACSADDVAAVVPISA